MHLDKEDAFHIFWLDLYMYHFFLELFAISFRFIEEHESTTAKNSFLNVKYKNEKTCWTEQGEKTVGAVGYRCQFLKVSDSGLPDCIALVELKIPLSDSGSARLIVYSYFAGLLKEICEETNTEPQGQISKSVLCSN